MYPRICAAALLLIASVAGQENANSLFRAGYSAYHQGNYYDAIRTLRRAEALDPNPSVLKLLALSYYGAHQNRLFLLKMNAAVQKQPADFIPYYYLGRY